MNTSFVEKLKDKQQAFELTELCNNLPNLSEKLDIKILEYKLNTDLKKFHNFDTFQIHKFSLERIYPMISELIGLDVLMVYSIASSRSDEIITGIVVNNSQHFSDIQLFSLFDKKFQVQILGSKKLYLHLNLVSYLILYRSGESIFTDLLDLYKLQFDINTNSIKDDYIPSLDELDLINDYLVGKIGYSIDHKNSTLLNFFGNPRPSFYFDLIKFRNEFKYSISNIIFRFLLLMKTKTHSSEYLRRIIIK